jgi:hypothetical protein
MSARNLAGFGLSYRPARIHPGLHKSLKIPHEPEFVNLFKEPRNLSPAYRVGTTTLFDVLRSTRIDSKEPIPPG